MAEEFIFKINGRFTPDTLPMERLAEYLADLSKLIGEPARVHFKAVTEGSVKIAYRVDGDAADLVETRVQAIRRGSAPVESMAAYRALNKRLREDQSSAEHFREGQTAEILLFPGATAPEEPIIDGMMQAVTIDGTIMRIGGKTKTKLVAIQSGDTLHTATATKAQAKALAAHLFEGELRFYGQGKWSRNAEGVWKLKKFAISSFDQLDNRGLRSVLGELRALHGGQRNPATWPTFREVRGDEELH